MIKRGNTVKQVAAMAWRLRKEEEEKLTEDQVKKEVTQAIGNAFVFMAMAWLERVTYGRMPTREEMDDVIVAALLSPWDKCFKCGRKRNEAENTDYATPDGFFRAWRWAKEQGWWKEFLDWRMLEWRMETTTYNTDGYLYWYVELINSTTFAITLAEWIQKSNITTIQPKVEKQHEH